MPLIIETTEAITTIEAIRRLKDESRRTVCSEVGISANTLKRSETGEYCSMAHARAIVLHLTGTFDERLIEGLVEGRTALRFELRPIFEEEEDCDERQDGPSGHPASPD